MCSVGVCNGKARALGMCRHHYHNSPLSKLTGQERFWVRVAKTDTCWLWTGALSEKGYGAYIEDGKVRQAHRVAWAWANYCPMPPSRLVVDHLCHVRHCMNPKHLRLVTSGQNTENRKGARRNSKAGIRGVSWHTASGKWVASVRSKGKLYNLGYFTDKYEAGEAAKQGRLKYHTHNDVDRK